MANSKLDSSSMIKAKSTNHETNVENKTQPLIPELPNDIAELCLYRIPYPYQAQSRSVSSSWNKAISHPSFLHSKHSLSLSLPYLFVSAFHKSTAKIQWQALDPRSGRWFVLPPMPLANATAPTSFACASLPRDGKLFVFGGMRNTGTSMHTTITYRTSTNRWSLLAPIRTPRAYSAAGNIGGKIIVAGGNGADHVDDSILSSSAELYDPENDTWTDAAKMRGKMGKYDAVVMGGKLYVTEGWKWPFMFTPRGQVYDIGKDTWEEMSEGMREGWTGLGAVVVGGRLVVISEHGGCRLKMYGQSGDDTWEIVGGGEFPCELVQRPFAVSELEGKICVVSSGLNVAIGRFYDEKDGERGFFVEWEVLKAPKAFQHFSPFTSQLLFA